MISYMLKLSCYDAAAGASFFGATLLIGPSAIALSPLYVAPIVLVSAVKTVWHRTQMFRLQNNLPLLERTFYMNRKHKFVKEDLNTLEHHLKMFMHKEEMKKSYKSFCNRAKGLIPVIGLIWLMYSTRPETSLKPQDTWTDLNALKYHIKYLKPHP